MRAIITVEETPAGVVFQVAKDGNTALSGVAETFGQAWDYCSLWALAEIGEESE